MVRRSARCRAHSRRAAVHMGRSDGLEVQLEVRSIYEGRSERRAGKGGGDRHGNRHEDRGDRRAAYSNVIDSAAIKDSAWRPVAVSVLVYLAASVTVSVPLAGHSEIRAPWGVGCCEAQIKIQPAGQANQLRRIDVDLVLDSLRKVIQRPNKLTGAVWLAAETQLRFSETYTGVAGEVGLKGHSIQVEVYGSIPGVEKPIGPPHVPSKLVKPPLERECGRGRDHFIATGGAHDQLHEEEEEDQHLQHKLNRDEGLALATRL
eukprot:scaffold13471_cov66-Phaeocystis_antarctica.AAC.4